MIFAGEGTAWLRGNKYLIYLTFFFIRLSVNKPRSSVVNKLLQVHYQHTLEKSKAGRSRGKPR